MPRQKNSGRTMGVDRKMEAAVRVLLTGNKDLERYLTLDGGRLVVRDYPFAGSGMSFLIRALISLWSGRAEDAIDLHRITDLDSTNQQLFLAALRAYLEA